MNSSLSRSSHGISSDSHDFLAFPSFFVYNNKVSIYPYILVSDFSDNTTTHYHLSI